MTAFTSLRMCSSRMRAALGAGLVLLAAAQPALARSAREEIEPAEERTFPFNADIPGCQDPSVLEKVSSRFAEKEAKFWNSSLTIVAIDRIEVLRDGASSLYGSDAIAGVINIQLSRREGVRGSVTYGQFRTRMEDVDQATGVAVGANGLPVVAVAGGGATSCSGAMLTAL